MKVSRDEVPSCGCDNRRARSSAANAPRLLPRQSPARGAGRRIRRGGSSATRAGIGLPRPCTSRPRPTHAPTPPNTSLKKILTSRSALEGERKQVTVLFADVKEGYATAARASDCLRVSRHD